jgi:hypothetical protein
MESFGKIRLAVIEIWYQELNRHRNEDELSDTYSESKWCEYQSDSHISFICSLNDWLDNISDLLQDDRYDSCTDLLPDENVLFRFYTRILLVISEIIEDFVMFNILMQGWDPKTKGIKRYSGQDLEDGLLFPGELLAISNFINSVCKHKTEQNNLHKHNHHLKIEFEDFGDKEHENQINLKNLNWKSVDKQTTILIPRLIYFINTLLKINGKILDNIENKAGYKDRMIEIFTKD